VELKEINSGASYDIVAIFEITKREEKDQAAQDWELGNFIDYFYGASDDNRKIIKIACDYIDDYLKKEIKDTLTQLENMLGLEGQSDDDQDMLNDEIGGRVDYLMGLLPFENEEEKNHYWDIFFSFKSWDDFKDYVMEIAKRLEK